MDGGDGDSGVGTVGGGSTVDDVSGVSGATVVGRGSGGGVSSVAHAGLITAAFLRRLRVHKISCQAYKDTVRFQIDMSKH